MISDTNPRDLLLLEPDRRHREQLSNYLGANDFKITTPGDQQELVKLANRQQFCLALIDAGSCADQQALPFDWAQTFCRRSDLGVILMSTEGSSRESVRALNLGADDYVSKPVHQAELLARIRAVIRRYPASNNIADDGRDWRLSVAGRHLLAPNGMHIRLTGRELELLSLLSAHQDQAVSRDQISMSLMRREWQPGDRSMDVLVRRLRAKLDRAGGRGLIKTERHIGYRLADIQVSH